MAISPMNIKLFRAFDFSKVKWLEISSGYARLTITGAKDHQWARTVCREPNFVELLLPVIRRILIATGVIASAVDVFESDILDFISGTMPGEHQYQVLDTAFVGFMLHTEINIKHYTWTHKRWAQSVQDRHRKAQHGGRASKLQRARATIDSSLTTTLNYRGSTPWEEEEEAVAET